jgi:hypothetical protein
MQNAEVSGAVLQVKPPVLLYLSMILLYNGCQAYVDRSFLRILGIAMRAGVPFADLGAAVAVGLGWFGLGYA